MLDAGPCSVLISRENKGLVVNRPFSQWVKLSDALSSHSKAAYHSDCLQAADILKATIENPDDVMQSTVTFCARLYMQHSFFGNNDMLERGIENVATAKIPGNFLILLKVFPANDPVLKSHLDKPAANTFHLKLKMKFSM